MACNPMKLFSLFVLRISELAFLWSLTFLLTLAKQRYDPVLAISKTITVPTRVNSTVSVRVVSSRFLLICEIDCLSR